VSTGADVAVLAPAGRAAARARRNETELRSRPGLRLATFAALALYGTLRWGSLMKPAPGGRLLGLAATTVALVALAQALRGRGRVLLGLLGIAAVISTLAFSGVPLAWITHLRFAATANAIGEGLSALPRVLVPYLGVNTWIRTVITLGAGVLLLDAALVVALASGAPSEGRRALAAVPLIALAAVPSTLVAPQVPYLQGLVLFALIAAFIWGERVRRSEARVTVGLAALAAVGGMIVAPALDRHAAWIDYQGLAGRLVGAHTESFDWTQRYGPLRWPRTGHDVLGVQAAHPDYWKAENLDLFDGRGWALGSIESTGGQVGVDASSIARWTQQLRVTLHGMKTSEVIGAGISAAPAHLPSSPIAGPSPGTWLAGSELGPGDSYDVTTYAPHPSAAALAAAGTAYPDDGLLPAYLSLGVPVAHPQPGAPPVQQVIFPPFGTSIALAYAPSSADPAAALANSPYARGYTLSRRLLHAAPTPYAYVLAVERYLSKGFSYDENPRPSRYPLESFLFMSHRGYCQQFAGAMALLLRMGGVPARVATGFTPGIYNRDTHSWVVSDLDAHAWVEAWFPHYGWVRFDPTPAAAPARGGRVPIPTQTSGGNSAGERAPVRRPDHSGSGSTGSSSAHHGGGIAVLPLTGAVLGGALLVIALLATVRRSDPTVDELLLELERAFDRCSRPLAPSVTLSEIERRVRSNRAAAAYVRALRTARFAGADWRPAPDHRRAMRAHLRAGLGLAGFGRALWALPPRFRLHAPRRKFAHRAVSGPSSRGIHSE
jgi:transglutaminase-like putative cysteine protease